MIDGTYTLGRTEGVVLRLVDTVTVLLLGLVVVRVVLRLGHLYWVQREG